MSEKEVKEVREVKDVKEKAARAGPVKTYNDLLVYKQAYRLALAVSQLTKLLPRHEQFELGRQLRRSARSIPANIVEGWTKRNSAADFKRHLVIASGETAETRFWMELAVDEGILPEESKNADAGILETGIYDSQSMEGVEEALAR